MGPHGTPILGAAEFDAMKPNTILVNCARGTLLDEEARGDWREEGPTPQPS